MNAQAGDLLKVSDFVNHGTVDGTWSVGTAAFDKRGVATFVPKWDAENCIQCNKCSYVCPHACIRPFVMDEAELAASPNFECYRNEGSCPNEGYELPHPKSLCSTAQVAQTA